VPPRRFNPAAALLDLALAALAFAGGWAGARPALFALLLLGAALVWGWTRRASLARMGAGALAANAALALTMLGVVLGAAYWLGLQLRG
jgi:hypothetical protein